MQILHKKAARTRKDRTAVMQYRVFVSYMEMDKNTPCRGICRKNGQQRG